MAALSLVTLDSLALPLAQRPIAHSLDVSARTVLWAMISLCLAWSVLQPVGCALRGRWGDRRAFATGQLLLAAGCAACAAAPDLGWLIAGRACQGAAAALIVPTALAHLGESVAPRLRGTLPTFAGGGAEVSAVLGSLACAGLVQWPDWRWIFWLNLPVCLVSLGLAMTHRWADIAPRRALDPVATAQFAIGAVGLVWALMNGDQRGWNSPSVLTALTVGLLLLGLYAADRIPLGAFRATELVCHSLGYACGAAVLFGGVYVLAEHFARAAGPLESWLRMAPCFAGLAACAPLSAPLARRIGPGLLVSAGLATSAAGLGALAAALDARQAYPVLPLPLLCTGAGLALALPAARRLAQTNTRPQAPGQELAASATLRMFAGAIGLATAGAIAGGGGLAAPSGAGHRGTVEALIVLAAISAIGSTANALGGTRRTMRPVSIHAGPMRHLDPCGTSHSRHVGPR
jgi:MFS family permease